MLSGLGKIDEFLQIFITFSVEFSACHRFARE